MSEKGKNKSYKTLANRELFLTIYIKIISYETITQDEMHYVPTKEHQLTNKQVKLH